MLTKLSLFSGIGGDDLASDWAGIKTICFVEKDKYCQQVLRKHWPGISIIEDVKDVARERVAEILMAYTDNERQPSDLGEKIPKGQNQTITNTKSSSRSGDGNAIPKVSGEQKDVTYAAIQRLYNQENEQVLESARSNQLLSIKPRNRFGIDIISGGFPCQPHSVAGKRKGSSDERNLWPEFRRILDEIKPRWVVAENVPGLFSSDNGDFFGGILSDLAALGYSVGWCCYGAVDVGALHRRDRVFIVAHVGQFREGDEGRGFNPKFQHSSTERVGAETRDRFADSSKILAYPSIKGLERAITGGAVSAERQPEQCGDVSYPDSTRSRSKSRNTVHQRGRTCEDGREGIQETAERENGSAISDIEPAGEVCHATSGGLQEQGLRPEDEQSRGTSEGNGHLCGVGQADTQSKSSDGLHTKRGNPQFGEHRGCSSEGGEYWAIEPNVGRVAHGVPRRVDRLKSLGNAVVPQQIYPIYKAIVEIEKLLEQSQEKML